MTCHEAREWLSDVIDDALDAETRAQVDGHLAGCADCRRELERLGAMVSLLRAVERPRAPAGFADRVLARVRPVPWHRRLRDRLAAIRLLRFPVEAAAVVLVASLAVYVFQETPALRRAARVETLPEHAADKPVSTEPQPAAPATAPGPAKDTMEVRPKSFRGAAPVPPVAPPTPPQVVTEPSVEERMTKVPPTAEGLSPAVTNRAPGPSDPAARAPLSPAPTAPPQGAPPPPGASSDEAALSRPAEGRFGFLRKDEASRDGGATGRPARQSPAPAEPAPPPELRDRMAREKDQERSESAAPAPLPAARPPAPAVMRLAPPAHVLGRLTVRDRRAANRELAELLSRVGGAETTRRAEAAGDTVGLVIPRAAYPAFTQGLARIGSWLPETEPSELPDRVPVTLRITQ